MEILNIIQGTNLGGMEQASLRLMCGLKEQGHAVRVLSLNPVGTLGPLLEKSGIVAKGLPYLGRGGWRSYRLLKKELQASRADALLMTGHHLLSMIALGNLCAGRRVLAVHLHHEGVKPAWQWRLIYWIACRRFPAITFPSEFIRKEAERIYPQVRLRAHTVRNPLCAPELPSAAGRQLARRELGLPEGASIIGNAGWLIGRKRFDVFLRVAQKVAESVPNSLFVIAGDGEEKARLQSLARELNIAGRVIWLGWQKELTSFYRSLDVMLFNSDWDAMGLSPLEAMSYAVPLVASVQHGGLGEIVDKDEYGYLIDDHDVAALSGKVLELLQNPETARRVGLAGRRRVLEVSNAEEHVAIIRSLLAGDAVPTVRAENVA